MPVRPIIVPSLRRIALLVSGLLLLTPASALAEPCGDIALEGLCEGSTRLYCNADELRTEDCSENSRAPCCGWTGTKYDCRSCSETCVEECLNGLNVFGCSLLNTHEWTCVLGDDGCTKRAYVACADGQICDEAGSHKCVDISSINLCGGISETGTCDGNIAKKCVDGQVQETDCAALGQSCLVGSCTADCPVACVEGQTGCLQSGQQWSCVQDPTTGCLVQAPKNCGAKICHEGQCKYTHEIESPPPVEEAGEDVAPTVSTPSDSGAGCSIQARGADFMETTLALLVTVAGLLFFLHTARRRESPPSLSDATHSAPSSDTPNSD